MLELRPHMGERRKRQIDAALAAATYRRGDGPKLTIAQAAEVRDRFAAGERAVDLATEYGVSKWLVYRIKEGKRAS
jgi:DNA invertase Pin-like site-specific DNA recombinase